MRTIFYQNSHEKTINNYYLFLAFLCQTNAQGLTDEERQNLIELAKSGNDTVQFSLGLLCEQAKDYEQAVYWYNKAAEQGFAEAQTGLGLMYISGNGVAVDYKRAMYWFELAAKQGQSIAQYCLGVGYDTGKGVNLNKKMAAYWYKFTSVS